jgi:Cytochrome P460
MSRKTLATAIAFIVCATAGPAIFAQSPTNPSALTRSRYLPQYNASGDMIFPPNSIWRDWVFVGSPLTPNALNDGHANFPEYHNVYIEPGSYEIYEKTNVFPEGTIMFKELQLTKKPEENPDGSRTEPSGRGYFPGAFNGADVTVKDSKRFAASGAGASSISTISNQRLRPPR